MLPDIIAVLAIALIVGGAVFYIVKAKKSGRKCIGCPDSKICGKSSEHTCSGSCGSCKGCSSSDDDKE